MTRHLLVIGAQRCGTTYLQSLLDAHPQIATARPARPEPKVFCSDDLTARGTDWYRSAYFAHAANEYLLSEKSTSYLDDPLAPARVLATLGDVDIGVVLRDPVRRAVSNWRFSTDNGFETRPLERALRENLVVSTPWDRESTSVSPFAYLERGRYVACLEPWLDTFPETVRVWFLEELVSDERAVSEAYAELGVDAQPPPDRHGKRVNASQAAAAPLPPDLTEELRAYFSDSDRALSQLLRRTLPWHDQKGTTADG